MNSLVRLLNDKGDRAGAAAVALEATQADLRWAEKGLAGAPNDPMILAVRGEALARLGQFEPALRDYDRAIELDASRATCWVQRACLHLFLDHREPYREQCVQMLRHFGDAVDPDVGDRVAMTCLLAPEPQTEPRVIARLIGLGASRTDPALRPWADQTRGVAQYRAGDSAAAVETLTRSRAGFTQGQWHAADFYLAMAHHRLGQAGEARACLDQGVARTRSTFVTAEAGDAVGGTGAAGAIPVDAAGWRVGADVSRLSGSLEDWLTCQIARREAEGLIGNPKGPANK
jgi:tetratricopeptide (TPR) repeat protein